MLTELLAPLRLPERLLEALDELRPMRLELTRVRKQTEPLAELLPALEALDELRPMRLELTRVRKQTEPLAELLPALQQLEEALGTRLDAVLAVVAALESDESHLNRTTRELGLKVEALSDVLAPVNDRLATIERAIGELVAEVGTMRETLVGVKDDIQRTTGLRGDRGVMERARDVFTGGNDEQERPDSQGAASGPQQEQST